MDKKNIGAMLLVLTPLWVSNALGAVTYMQGPNATMIDTSAIYNVPYDPGFTWSLDQDEEAWAYFTSPVTGTFNQITWFGSNADLKFGVDFYEASCFSCGATGVKSSGKFTNNLLPKSGPFDQLDIQKTAVSSTLYAYTLALSSSVTINQGSLYALSIVNNYSAYPFSWAGSDVGSGMHLRYIVGQAMFLKAPGNLAFSLEDTSVPAVPEQTKFAMMLAGLAMLRIVTIRQSNRQS